MTPLRAVASHLLRTIGLNAGPTKSRRGWHALDDPQKEFRPCDGNRSGWPAGYARRRIHAHHRTDVRSGDGWKNQFSDPYFKPVWCPKRRVVIARRPTGTSADLTPEFRLLAAKSWRRR